MWTEAQLNTAIGTARAIASGQSGPAHVIDKRGDLVAVGRVFDGDKVIVRNVEAHHFSGPEVTALRQAFSEIINVRDALDRVRQIMTAREGGKRWSPAEKRKLVEAVADSWSALA